MSKLIMMCGIPGSGKSYQAKIMSDSYDVNIHSSDNIRLEFNLTEQTKECNTQVFQILHDRIKADLKNNKDVVYDATNISYKNRMNFLDQIKSIPCEKICCFVATPYEDCIENNKNRDSKVPEFVITRMYKNFYVPQYFEGWDDIKIIWNFKKDNFDVNDLFNGENGLNKMSQDNPHHDLTIGKHCIKCADILDEKYRDCSEELFMAALFHDEGKRFTKEFKNSKGEPSDIAHYYQHHLTGAYDVLFYCSDVPNVLDIVKYITWHMQPFFSETEKSKNKYINLLGENFWNDVLKLHECDKLAKDNC